MFDVLRSDTVIRPMAVSMGSCPMLVGVLSVSPAKAYVGVEGRGEIKQRKEDKHQRYR